MKKNDIITKTLIEEKKLLERILNNKKRFEIKDILQVIIGATILAVPVAFTEETWNLGSTLPLGNILAILLLTLLFISLFVYSNYHGKGLKGNKINFLKRVLSTYLFSFLVVGLILTLIQRAPWEMDLLLAFKRTVIVTLPSSMSAVIADTIK